MIHSNNFLIKLRDKISAISDKNQVLDKFKSANPNQGSFFNRGFIKLFNSNYHPSVNNQLPIT